MNSSLSTPEPVAPTRDASGHEIKTLTSFLKAIKSVGLYPEGSPVPDKIAAAFAADLAHLFEEQEQVQITFRAGTVYLNGAPLPESGEALWDLPVALFELGLRDLTFIREVTPEELCTLVRQLSRAARRELDSSEEDLSVMLWEMDLPGITYRAVDVGEESEANASFEAAEDCEEDAEIREIWDSLHPLERYASNNDGGDIPADDAAFEVRDEELELLRQKAKIEPSGMSYKFVLVLLELVLHDLPPAEYERAKAVLPDAFLKLIHAGRFRTFARLAARLLDRARRCELSGQPGLRELGPRLLGSEAAETALTALRAGRCDDPEAAFVLMSSFDAAGLRVVLEEAIEGARGPGKAELRVIPERVIQQVIAERPSDLFSGETELTAEEMRYLAACVDEEAGDAEGWVARMAPYLAGDSAEIRERALEILCRVQPATIEKTLLDCLHDPEPRVRHLALRETGRILGSRAFAPLREIISSDDFGQKEFDERAAFFEAMTEASPEEAFPILSGILQHRDWFSSTRRREEKACALRGLGEYQGEAAMPLLLKHRRSRDQFLAEACREALARQHRRARESVRTLEQAA